MTHWGRAQPPFDLEAARRFVAGVLIVGFMASLHKKRMVEILNHVQRDRCGICGKAMLQGRGRRKRSLEHVWSKADGGRDGVGNFVAAHVRCNHEKGGKRPTGCQIIMLIAVCEVLDVPLQLKADQPPWRLPPPGK